MIDQQLATQAIQEAVLPKLRVEIVEKSVRDQDPYVSPEKSLSERIKDLLTVQRGEAFRVDYRLQFRDTTGGVKPPTNTYQPRFGEFPWGDEHRFADGFWIDSIAVAIGPRPPYSVLAPTQNPMVVLPGEVRLGESAYGNCRLICTHTLEDRFDENGIWPQMEMILKDQFGATFPETFAGYSIYYAWHWRRTTPPANSEPAMPELGGHGAFHGTLTSDFLGPTPPSSE